MTHRGESVKCILKRSASALEGGELSSAIYLLLDLFCCLLQSVYCILLKLLIWLQHLDEVFGNAAGSGAGPGCIGKLLQKCTLPCNTIKAKEFWPQPSVYFGATELKSSFIHKIPRNV